MYKFREIIKYLFTLFFCFFFIAMGGVLVCFLNKEKEICTVPVDAVVADLVYSRSKSKTKTAIFEYSYEGSFYRVKNNSSSSPSPFKIGERVKIYIEPGNPEHLYCPKGNSSMILSVVFILLGSAGIFYFFYRGLKKEVPKRI